MKGFDAKALREEERGWMRDECGDWRRSDKKQAGLFAAGG